jgi:hypothetical protein
MIVDEREARQPAAAPLGTAAAAGTPSAETTEGQARGEAAAAAAPAEAPPNVDIYAAVALRDAVLLDTRVVLPVVWGAAVFDEFVCKFVTGRWAHCN